MSNVEVQMRGNYRSVGLFNSVARSLHCAVLRTASVGMTEGKGKVKDNFRELEYWEEI